MTRTLIESLLFPLVHDRPWMHGHREYKSFLPLRRIFSPNMRPSAGPATSLKAATY
jgi:hypothetical protein